MSALTFPKGVYRFGNAVVLQVVHASEQGTGLVSNSNPLDDFMGQFQFRVDCAQLSAYGRKLRIAPELLAYWFLAHAVAEILVQQLLPKSGDVAVNATSIMLNFVNREEDDAHRLFGKLVAIEIVSPLLFRLLGREFDRDGADRIRLMALTKLKDKGVQVEALIPGRHPKVLGPWGQKLYPTLQKTILPQLRNIIGGPDGPLIIAE